MTERVEQPLIRGYDHERPIEEAPSEMNDRGITADIFSSSDQEARAIAFISPEAAPCY
jgi:hypothetical protein